MTPWKVALISWCVVLAGCVVFSAYWHLVLVPTDTFDQPIAVISAARTARGKMPFRDFDAYYGPLGHYLAAGAIILQAGTSPMRACQRLFFTLSLFNLGVIGWCIPRILQQRGVPLLGGAVILALIGPLVARFSFHCGAELAPILATLLLIPATGDTALSTASVIGLAALDILLLALKLNFGAYAFAAAILVLLLDVLLFGRRGSMQALFIYCSALLIFGAVFVGAMLASGMLYPYADTLWNAIRLNYARHVPLGSLHPSSLIQCIGLLFLFALLSILTAFDSKLRRNRVLVYSLALCVGCIHYALFRFDPSHSLFLLVELFVALIATVVYAGRPRWLSPPRLALLGFAILAAAAMPDSTAYWLTGSLKKHIISHLMPASAKPISSFPLRSMTQEVRNGVAISSDESRMLDSMLSTMKPAGEVFWASKPGSCQSTFDTCVNYALYLAMNRLPTTHHWIFDVVTSQYSSFQDQMVREIDARKLRFVGVQQNLLRQPSGGNPLESTVFYDFVRSHYLLTQSFYAPDRSERFEIYERNTS